MQNITNSELKLTYINSYSLNKYFSQQLIESMQLKRVDAGEYLVAQGSKLINLDLVVDGKLQVEHFEIDGNRAVFSIEKAFSVIGDLELFHDAGTEIISTVKAITQTDILRLPLSKIEQYGLNDAAFLRFICIHLSNKLYVSSQLHSHVAFPAIFKVRKYLAFRAESDGATFQLEKREILAAMLGISVRQLNRALKLLAEQKLVQYKNKTIVILDREKLGDITPSDV